MRTSILVLTALLALACTPKLRASIDSSRSRPSEATPSDSRAPPQQLTEVPLPLRVPVTSKSKSLGGGGVNPWPKPSTPGEHLASDDFTKPAPGATASESGPQTLEAIAVCPPDQQYAAITEIAPGTAAGQCEALWKNCCVDICSALRKKEMSFVKGMVYAPSRLQLADESDEDYKLYKETLISLLPNVDPSTHVCGCDCNDH